MNPADAFRKQIVRALAFPVARCAALSVLCCAVHQRAQHYTLYVSWAEAEGDPAQQEGAQVPARRARAQSQPGRHQGGAQGGEPACSCPTIACILFCNGTAGVNLLVALAAFFQCRLRLGNSSSLVPLTPCLPGVAEPAVSGTEPLAPPAQVLELEEEGKVNLSVRMKKKALQGALEAAAKKKKVRLGA